MTDILSKTLLLIAPAILCVSCSTVETVQPLSAEEKQSTATVHPSLTALPTITALSMPFVTPFPTPSAQVTIAAFDSLCTGAMEILDSQISPYGNWIAAECYGENNGEESPLQV